MDWDVVFSYTRAQAIEDGVLIAVDPELVKEVGFKIPIALTSTLYGNYIKSNLPGQDEIGRLWDLLFMLRLKSDSCETSILLFEVVFQMTEEKSETVTLKAVIGPGDKIEDGPVLTVMLPNED